MTAEHYLQRNSPMFWNIIGIIIFWPIRNFKKWFHLVKTIFAGSTRKIYNFWNWVTFMFTYLKKDSYHTSEWSFQNFSFQSSFTVAGDLRVNIWWAAYTAKYKQNLQFLILYRQSKRNHPRLFSGDKILAH